MKKIVRLRIFTEKRMHYKVLVVLHFFCERQLVKVDTLRVAGISSSCRIYGSPKNTPQMHLK
jgi:hypothetical protein